MYHSDSSHGENLAMGYDSMEAVVDAWYKEEKDYDYDNPQFSMETGHFTQVVWKETTELGCAIAVCPDSDEKIYVCQYNPPGNYLNQFGANVLPLKE
mmetsp:Transcript_7773/g.21166  ORF Transcript_7773/g.21166 Transcript_7773/m.21166 type:complete len:97 (+) Transcript_7773:2-292(+)